MSHASPPPIVFVVDDDVSVREPLELLIRNEGWQAETFQSAQEFLAHARVVAPSCLVLDVTLPGLSGLDLQKRVLDRTDMPIIFITGYGDVPMTVQAMKAGAVEFLTKPFSADVLVDAIRNHGKGAPRQCHAEDGSRFPRRPGDNGRATPPPARIATIKCRILHVNVSRQPPRFSASAKTLAVTRLAYFEVTQSFPYLATPNPDRPDRDHGIPTLAAQPWR